MRKSFIKFKQAKNTICPDMLKLILIDDEPESLQVISSLIEMSELPTSILSTFTDPQEGLNYLTKVSPDVLLLDIEMPGITGLELLKRLPKIDFEIIFITAYNQYAVNAIKLSAIDYLLKPVGFSDLEQALIKAKDKIQKKESLQKLDILADLLKSNNQPNPSQDHRIVLPTFETLEFVKMSDIIRIEAAQNYCNFHIKDRNPLIISKNIGVYEDSLDPYNFMRVHRSHIINLNAVVRYHRQDGGAIEMDNGYEVPVSHSKKEQLVSRLSGL